MVFPFSMLKEESSRLPPVKVTVGIVKVTIAIVKVTVAIVKVTVAIV